MKIWKSDLQGLLEEVEGPLYLFASSETRGGQMPVTTFVVSVAGFNQEGHVCELRLARPPVITTLVRTREWIQEHEANLKMLGEVRARLTALGRTVLDGKIGEEPVSGVLG